MSKVTLHTMAQNGGAFNCAPAGEWQLSPETVLCNDVTFPGEYNPHNVRLWIIGHEFGPVGAVWAQCEQDALDELVDSGLGDCFLIDEKDADEDCSRLGNAGEPANLDNAWMRVVEFAPDRDWQIMLRFAEARGAGHSTLDY